MRLPLFVYTGGLEEGYMDYNWRMYAKRADFSAIGKKYNIDQVVARVITNRDVCGDAAIARYLYGSYEGCHDGRGMADMDKACRIMSEKIQQGKSIRIISDYDVDGVMSNYILYDGLVKAGARVTYEIPDRMLDGYGINERIIRAAYEDGVDTIITCDNGIAAFPAIELGKELGMTMVVTDHHDIPYEIEPDGGRSYRLVPADAIIDNKRVDCEYPFKGLCGAGVAYKFIRCLYACMGIEWQDEDRYIDMLAIATQCDVMELVDENRIYVKKGLSIIEHTKNIGLKELLTVNNLSDKEIKSYHLGFVIGPCINATGRLDSAKRGLALLLEENQTRARQLARELYELNASRKQMTETGVREGIELVEKHYLSDTVLVVYMPKLHESLAGIVAGKLREKYYKPVLVITDSEDGLVKGSGRSIEGYHMFDALTECADLLVKYGGHELAAGFSLKKTDLDELRRQLNEKQRLTKELLTPILRIDVPMPVAYITEKLVGDLALLEPFGKGNEKPIFGQSGLRIKRADRIGREGQYLKLTFMDESGYTVQGIDFNAEIFISSIKMWFGETECDKMFKGISNAVVLDVAYYPDVNEYNGRKQLQIKPITYRKHE